MSFSYEKVQSKNIILAGFRDQVSPKILQAFACIETWVAFKQFVV